MQQLKKEKYNGKAIAGLRSIVYNSYISQLKGLKYPTKYFLNIIIYNNISVLKQRLPQT